MLRIRDEQMAVFQRDFEQRADRRFEAAVRAAWPDATRCLDDVALRQRIRRATERAGLRGYTDRELAQRWVHLTFAAGERFDEETAWAPVILGWGAAAERTMTALEEAAGAGATGAQE